MYVIRTHIRSFFLIQIFSLFQNVLDLDHWAMGISCDNRCECDGKLVITTLFIAVSTPRPKGRRGKTDGSGQVESNGFAGQNGSFLNGLIRVASRVYPYFSNNFFFQLQKQINNNMFRENE